MNTISKRITILSIALMFLLSACKANFSRNQDGSFDVETTISQQELQEAITASLADPLVREVTVSLQSGYVLVSGVRARLNDPNKTDALSFRLVLGVSNGQLAASISNAICVASSLASSVPSAPWRMKSPAPALAGPKMGYRSPSGRFR